MMSTKATFWFAIVALVTLGSAVALPVDANAPAIEDEKAMVSESVSPKVDQEPLETLESDKSTGSTSSLSTGTEQWELPKQEAETNTGESKTPVVDLQLPLEKTDKPELSSDVEIVTKPNQEGSTLSISPPNQGQNPRPYYTGGVQTVNMGPAVSPFLLEFFRPFQPFQGPPPLRFHQQSQNPFAISNDQFDPFVNPMRMPSFDQLVNSYTDEFRHMLESLEKSMMQMDNVNTKKEGPTKPVGKTTTKTEIIDGHLVQTDETTYTGGDENHKTFYHIKEIKVIPENSNKKVISSEKIESSTKDDSELQKEETNEIKNTMPVSDLVADSGDSKQNNPKKAPGFVPLDDHFQTAAATYYAPYAPYGSHPALYYPRPDQFYYGTRYPPANYGGGDGRPPVQAPISLHGDTYVNQLAAAQQQASGAHATLPPDVELIDVHGKPLRGDDGGQYFHNNRQHQNGHKFPGRKNN